MMRCYSIALIEMPGTDSLLQQRRASSIHEVKFFPNIKNNLIKCLIILIFAGIGGPTQIDRRGF